MQAIILVGLQASGKSSFYKELFFDTHIRINLDMLRTRHRERLLLHACIEMKQGFVIDNTNPTQAGRAPYIDAAQQAGFSVAGYYFDTRVGDCLARNKSREGSARIPAVGIYGTAKKLQPPTYSEGFDVIYYVRISSDGGFVVEELPRPTMSPHTAWTVPLQTRRTANSGRIYIVVQRNRNKEGRNNLSPEGQNQMTGISGLHSANEEVSRE